MRILAISPHPDDVEYGLAGILLRLRACQHKITVLYNTKYDLYEDAQSISHDARSFDIKNACTMMNAEYGFFSIDDTLSHLASCMVEEEPDIIFLPALHDHNLIHQRVHIRIKETIETARKQNSGNGRFHLHQVFYYETFSSTNFEPNFIADVTKEYALAKRILQAHQIGIQILPSLLYRHQLMHQLRGFECSCLYGEGLQIEQEIPYLWKDNRKVGLQMLSEII